MSPLAAWFKNTGNRLTKPRSQIISLLEAASQPLSAVQIIKQVKANKTTVYRDLDFLVSQKIVDRYDFADGKGYYELSSKGPHHHLICTHCRRVECYEADADLTVQAKNIAQLKKFHVTSHSLNFFGTCAECN